MRRETQGQRSNGQRGRTGAHMWKDGIAHEVEVLEPEHLEVQISHPVVGRFGHRRGAGGRLTQTELRRCDVGHVRRTHRLSDPGRELGKL